MATLFPQLLPGRIQLTELLFLLALWWFRQDLWEQVKKQPFFAATLAFYCGVNLLSAAISGAAIGEGVYAERSRGAGAVMEALARCYLGVLVFVVMAHVDRYGTATLEQWWKWSAGVVSGIGIIVYLVWLVSEVSLLPWLDLIPNYPYLGDVGRLRGPAPTYGMLFMLLLPGFFLAWEATTRKRSAWWLVVLIGSACLLTLGKELLLLPVGVLLALLQRKTALATKISAGTLRPFFLVGAVVISLVLLVGTHLLVVRPGDAVSTTAYTSGRVITQLGGWELLETNYTTNKRAAWLIGNRNPWLGVGPGQFSVRTADLVAAGEYPGHFGRFDPHSAYTGALAETGWLGFMALLLMIYSLFRLYPQETRHHWWVLLLLFLLAAIFKDVMNFRGLWLIIGMYLADSRPALAETSHPVGGTVRSVNTGG